MTGLPADERVAVWDRALAAVRATLRGAGMREVTTPVRTEANALEPFIEPVPVGDEYLQTSPELEMKRLICAGSGSIFQVAPCWRRGERGRLHAEEFRLVEWYRVKDDEGAVIDDVEALVQAVFEAVGGVAPPTRWERIGVLDAIRQTTGVALRGDEDAQALAARTAVSAGPRPSLTDRDVPTDVRTLLAWSGFFSAWSDERLDPWLQGRAPGVHLVDFPGPLCALAQRHGPLARRFESHVHGVELCNGYRELRDAAEQRRRFETVAGLREHLGAAALPMPEAFLADLGHPGLPACAGAALGLDRLVMLACARGELGEIRL